MYLGLDLGFDLPLDLGLDLGVWPRVEPRVCVRWGWQRWLNYLCMAMGVGTGVCAVGCLVAWLSLAA